MKKLFIMLTIVLLISGCSNEYETWKEINISNVGSLKIPQEWVYNEKDDIIYVSDKNISNSTEHKIYLIGIVCEKGQMESLYQQFDEKMEYVKLISSETFSNSVIIGKNEYLIDGKSREKIFLDMYSSDKQLYIIVWDDSIEYEIVKRIGKSYKMNTDN